MADNQVIMRPQILNEFISELFQKTEMNKKDADYHAKALVDTNLWGVDSHGVIRVPAYFRRVQNKALNANPDIKKINGMGALEVLDGDAGSGFVVARTAMERAIELAKEYSVGMVGVINSNHFGAAALYSRMAVAEGMVGLAMTNVKPLVIAKGASKPVVGNNPFSIAIPTYGDFPFVLDVALSKVAGGKLTLAIKKKEKIPMDWATDSEGKPTDNPNEAFKGFLMPMGDHKGLGIAYVIDILTGVLTSGVCGHALKSMYAAPTEPSLTCHMMMAINSDSVITREEMQLRMDDYYSQLKATPMWDENSEMLLPGELEHRTYKKRMETGLPIPTTTLEELKALKEELGIKAPLDFETI